MTTATTKKITDNAVSPLYGKPSYTIYDHETGEQLDHYEGSNVVVLGGREALINSMISSSSSYRISRVILANDISDGLPTQHRVLFDSIVDGSNVTGLSDDTTEYTIDVNIDNTLHTITVTGQDAQTFNTLLNVIETELSGLGVEVLYDDDELVVRADTLDPERIVEFDTDADNLFVNVNSFDSFLNPINYDSPEPADQTDTLSTIQNNSTRIYDKNDYPDPGDTVFGTFGSLTIIINELLIGQTVIDNLGLTINDSVEFTSAGILTNNEKLFAHVRFPRLSISSSIDVNIVWQISYEPFA